MKSPRTAPLILHLLGHPDDSVENIVPRAFDVMKVVHPGRGPAPAIVNTSRAGIDHGPYSLAADMSSRLGQGVSYSGYLWDHRLSPLCAPSEFINMGVTMSLSVRHIRWNKHGDPDFLHVPTLEDFVDGSVVFNVGVPTGIDPGSMSDSTSSAHRVRSPAVTTLANAASHPSRSKYSVTVTEMPISYSAPVFHRPAPVS
jgi:hypothetical protein